MSKKYIIYITTNLINGKKYIGSHICDNIDDEYIGSGVYLKKAIKKYGKYNFKKSILAEVISAEEMKDLEMYYLDYYNAYNSLLFYNATKYPAGVTNITEDHKQRISKVNKGNKYNQGRIWSEESKQRVSQANKGKKKNEDFKQLISNTHKGKQYRLGHKCTEETKQKMGQSRKGHKCYQDPERAIKISKSNKGKKRSEETKQKMRKPQPHKRKIYLQYDLENNFIREFKGLKEISSFLNVPQATRIIDVCKGKFKTAYNYKWYYKTN
jgi:group I intron endonuclease